MAIGKNKAAEIKNSFEILKLPSPFSPLYLKTKFKPRFKHSHMWAGAQPEIRSGGLFWGSWGGAPICGRPLEIWERSPLPLEAGNLGAKPPAAGGTGSGSKPPALDNFAFFCKNNLILGLFWSKVILLKRDIEIGSANMIKLVAWMVYVVGG